MAEDREHEGGRGVVIHDRVLFGADDLVSRWVAARIPQFQPTEHRVALGVIVGEDLAAGVVYDGFNQVHCEVAIAAEASTPWASRAALRHLFGYPFVQLGLRAMSVRVAATNLESLNLATKLGFTPEAFIRFAAPDGSDLVILKMHADTCRWIGHG